MLKLLQRQQQEQQKLYSAKQASSDARMRERDNQQYREPNKKKNIQKMSGHGYGIVVDIPESVPLKRRKISLTFTNFFGLFRLFPTNGYFEQNISVQEIEFHLESRLNLKFTVR